MELINLKVIDNIFWKKVEENIDKVLEKIMDEKKDKIMEYLYGQAVPSAWQKIFIDSSIGSISIERDFADYIKGSRTLRRLYFLTFDRDNIFPSFKDFSVSIGMEVLDRGIRCSADSIIQFSAELQRQWVNTLMNDEALKSNLDSINKSIPSQAFVSESDIKSICSILNNKDLLRKEFFQSFSKENCKEFIRVWLPNSHGYISRNDSTHVDIKVNMICGLELGFFRVGYQYELFIDDKSEYLHLASFTPQGDRESARFSGRDIGVVTNSIFWAI